MTINEQKLRDSYLRLSPKRKLDFLNSLSIEDWLKYRYILLARDKQLPPPGDWRHWLMLLGRGYGKNWTGSNFIKRRVEMGEAKHILIAAPTISEVIDNCIMGKSGLLALYDGYPDKDKPRFVAGNNPKVYFPNGAIINCRSAEKPDKFRGGNYDTYWCDELSSWRYEESFTQLRAAFRANPNCRGIITTTPRPTDLIKSLASNNSGNVAVVRGTTYEAVDVLGLDYIRDLESNLTATQIRQELLAEIIEDAPGALFNRSNIDFNRRISIPLEALKRIVVAVDPSVSSHKQSDETGIIVAGIGFDNRFYVLADYSGQYTPYEWAKQVESAYNAFKADRIIAESNQGGALVESNIQAAISNNLPIKLIHASRGKYSRAEPISALYEQNRVSHIGVLAKLEDQMCTWIAGETTKSPDRMDALVYALAELSGNKSILCNQSSFSMVRCQSDRAFDMNR